MRSTFLSVFVAELFGRLALLARAPSNALMKYAGKALTRFTLPLSASTHV
jgi:hypothetical protein